MSFRGFFFKDKTEQDETLLNVRDEDRNNECSTMTYIISGVGVAIGTVASVAGLALYAVSDKDTNPYHKDNDHKDDQAAVGAALGIAGAVLLGISVSTMLGNKLRNALTQKVHDNQLASESGASFMSPRL